MLCSAVTRAVEKREPVREVTQLYRGRATRIPTISVSVAGVVFFGLVLSGCASMEMLQPTESPVTSAPPLSAEVPAPDLKADTALIEISATGFDLLDAAGDRIDSFDYYDDDSADAISVLTELFESEPKVQIESAGSDLRAYDKNSWKGFAVWNYGSVGDDPGQPAFAVHVTAASVAHIDIATNDGITIGDTEADLVEDAYNTTESDADGRPLTVYSFDETLLPDGVQTYIEDGPAAYSVQAVVFADEGTVSEITAPNANFGS